MSSITGILSSLNPQQRECVTFIEKPLLVLAGAGSGKTKVLTHKFAYMVSHLNLSPQRILAITFTNKAANEMKERISFLLRKDFSQLPYVSTFHSLGNKILRKFYKDVGVQKDFTILDRNDSLLIIEEILKEENKKLSKKEVKELFNNIAKLRYQQIESYSFSNDKLCEILEKYEEIKRKTNQLDFDDLLLILLRNLKTNDSFKQKVSELFDYILVDEYQDTNLVQAEIVKLILKDKNSITAVGDPDQAIYTWRGADVNVILNFTKDFPQGEIKILEQNYRSTASILNAANVLISHNTKRYPKKLWTLKDEGKKPKLITFSTEKDEAKYIASQIKILHNKGLKLDKIAILYRINSMSRIYEEELIKNNIPYKVVKGISFYERKEIKDIISFLKVAVNPKDFISMARIINLPSRGIGKISFDKIKAEIEKLYEKNFLNSENAWKSLTKQLDSFSLTPKAKKGFSSFINDMINIYNLSQNSIWKAVEYILNEIGYLDTLKTFENKEERLQNIQELFRNAKGSITEFLSEIALYTDQDIKVQTTNKVNLMTIHAAKGLEFNTVFIVGLEEGVFPYIKRLDSPLDIEEERRLFYVAMTRAKEELYISYVKKRKLFGTSFVSSASRFVLEIPTYLVEKEDLSKEDDYFSRGYNEYAYKYNSRGYRRYKWR